MAVRREISSAAIPWVTVHNSSARVVGIALRVDAFGDQRLDEVRIVHER